MRTALSPLPCVLDVFYLRRIVQGPVAPRRKIGWESGAVGACSGGRGLAVPAEVGAISAAKSERGASHHVE
jgi:hypothetical protein